MVGYIFIKIEENRLKKREPHAGEEGTENMANILQG